MEPSGEPFRPVETQPPSQEALKSMYDLSTFIARKGILAEDRHYYQAVGIIKSLSPSVLIALTVPGPKQKELTPNELEVYFDMMLVSENKKGLHIFEYDIKKKKQGKSQTYTIERRYRREDLNLSKEQIKGNKQGNDFPVLLAQGSNYLLHLQERIKTRKERKQVEKVDALNEMAGIVTGEQVDDLNEMLAVIKKGGFTTDLAKGHKKFQESGGGFVDISF